MDLIQIADAALASAAERSGGHMVCHAGCSQCCVGVFAIALQDGDRLAAALGRLDVDEAGKAARIRARVRQSVARLDPWFPGDSATGILQEEYEQTILFEEFANDEPCPVLDPATGTCDLYDARPILCRTFGPPMRTEEGNLATCELCYIHASTEEIAACELDPGLAAVEEEANAAYDAMHHRRGQTLIAYALRDG